MIYWIYTFACLLLVVLQTTVFIALLPSYFTYDLLIPLVVCLALFHSPVSGGVFLLVPGLVMGSVSGGPTGIYLLVYFWLFLGIRLAVNFVERDSPVVIIAAIAVGVILEHVVFCQTGRLAGYEVVREINSYGILTARTTTAVLTGPFLLLLFRRMAAYVESESGRQSGLIS